MVKPIAYVYGTAIAPGVSRNGRLYTKDMIREAVNDAQKHVVAEGDDMPLSQLTHHDANDDSLRLTGRLLSLTYEESTGKAKFKAAIPPTTAGRDIHALVDTTNGTPWLKGVSIRGAWTGPERTITHEGQTVKTSDGLRLVGLDYTATPGVHGAVIDRVETVPGGPQETVPGGDPGLILESAVDGAFTDAPAEIVEKTVFADPGYLPDKAKRLPLDTRADAVATWRALREANDYSDAQRKRVRERTYKALDRHGLTVTPEKWVVSPAAQVTEMDIYSGVGPGSFCVSIDNGTVQIQVSSYSIDPADLDVAARAAMDGACQALAAMDPDADGDIDTPDTGSPAESAPAESAPRDDAPIGERHEAPETPDATPAAGQPHTQEEVPGMAEPTVTPAAGIAADATPAPSAPVEASPAAPAEPQLTLSQVKDLFASFAAATAPQPALAGAPAESAPAAPVAETVVEAPAVVAETQEQLVARLVQEGITKAVQGIAESSGVQRKGLVEAAPSAPVGDVEELPAEWPQKPLSQYTAAERRAYLNPALEQAVMGSRSVYRQA